MIELTSTQESITLDSIPANPIGLEVNQIRHIISNSST